MHSPWRSLSENFSAGVVQLTSWTLWMVQFLGSWPPQSPFTMMMYAATIILHHSTMDVMFQVFLFKEDSLSKGSTICQSSRSLVWNLSLMLEFIMIHLMSLDMKLTWSRSLKTVICNLCRSIYLKLWELGCIIWCEASTVCICVQTDLVAESRFSSQDHIKSV